VAELIADSFLGLTNSADPSCLLICDSTDNLNEPLRAYRFRTTAWASTAARIIGYNQSVQYVCCKPFLGCSGHSEILYSL
jgi:hypothetical protein